MTEFRADLHCHTLCSDGSASPETLLHLAKQVGLSGLSITDHDTIDAYVTAIPLAKELKIELISGAEFSAVHEKVSVHILSYAFPLESPIIHDLCLRHQQRRKKRNQAILNLLAEHKMPLSEEEIIANKGIFPSHTIGRPHIALAMIKKGYVSSISDAFRKYLGDGKCCFVQGESFSVEETLKIIHEAKGLAVIAHPHLLNHPKTLEQLLQMDFDGVEGFYANFTDERNKPWVRLGKEKGWLITGGSDFHGNVKPQINLGASWTPENTFRILQKHYENN